MGAYELKEVVERWQAEKLTTEQAIGQVLQHLQELKERLGEVERRLREVERGSLPNSLPDDWR